MAFLPSIQLQPPRRTQNPHPTLHPKSSLQQLNEPSTPLPIPKTPIPYPSTTIYHLLPSPSPHLPCPTHPNDNDVSLLAISLRTPWLRARYPRTKPLILETRVKKRVYRGLHGTPVDPGINASTKPKSLPERLFALGKWVFVANRGLPYKISPRDLVTFGNTALGDVLAEEISDGRGTELVQGMRFSRSSWVVTNARSPTGRVLRSYVVECGEVTRRVATLERVQAREIVVSDDFVLVVSWSVESVGGVKGLLKGLFGGSERLDVDVSKGCVVHVLKKDGTVVRSVTMEGLLSGLMVEQLEDGVRVTAKRVLAKSVSVTTVEDVRSGDAFKNGDDGIESSMVQFEIGGSGVGEVRVLGEKNIAVMDVTKVYDGELTSEPVYIGYNRSTHSTGLWDLQGQHWETKPGNRLSGALYSPGHTHISVLQTGSDPPKFLFFTNDLSAGPVCEIPLEGIENVHTSIDGVWTDFDYEWTEDNAKIVKSAYELFAEKNWNDIESGFSSLGLRL